MPEEAKNSPLSDTTGSDTTGRSMNSRLICGGSKDGWRSENVRVIEKE